ncbi:MAG: hypothetical protein ACJATT_003700 [Myxococcota bacterium]
MVVTTRQHWAPHWLAIVVDGLLVVPGVDGYNDPRNPVGGTVERPALAAGCTTREQTLGGAVVVELYVSVEHVEMCSLVFAREHDGVFVVWVGEFAVNPAKTTAFDCFDGHRPALRLD